MRMEMIAKVVVHVAGESVKTDLARASVGVTAKTTERVVIGAPITSNLDPTHLNSGNARKPYDPRRYCTETTTTPCSAA